MNMSFNWIEPRIRVSSLEPRIKITKKFVSINSVCFDKFFKNYEYVKIGYDEKEKKIIFVPVAKDNKNGMKIISNTKSKYRYINASKLFKCISIGNNERGEYECVWDDVNKGVLINLTSDKVK